MNTNFTPQNVLETIKMIEEENLDIRTITMGISLLDCIDSDGDKAREKIYNKIMTSAKDLVKVGREIENEFGIPIVNKRVSVTPISIIGGATNEENYVEFAKTLDKAANELGIDFIGGFSALVHKGCTKGDKILIKSIPEALKVTEKVCSSVNVGSSKCGINMNAVRDMGEIIKETAELTKDKKGFGCAKLVVFANAVEDNPFMAGAFHGVGEADIVINVGVSGPGVVQRALEKVKGESFDVVADTIKNTAFKITRMGQLVAKEASKRLGVPFGIVDLSLAPTPAVGDSVAHILEEIGLECVGTHGTTAALALLNDAVKKGGVMACSHVGGLSGAFIPVSEDAGMIDAVINGSLNLEKLEAMTAVCSVGLDMIAIPGDTKASTISAMIADEAAIGVINNKTTAVRIIPAPGCKVGDMVEFGGLLGRAPVMKVNENSSELFAARGGRIPAPIHSFKN
ncbi:PFL family protein [Clostridium sp. HBUAS56017]|uniref:PFL family protein n=1 Tax=Clostridium sp. HBUAS56017 TaxID=2571128 RepID=UPI0011775893|nr:PFL family protein [Clostridium sp. HBUAS56017]